MPQYDLSLDPAGVEAQQIERRRQLAELLISQGMNGPPAFSPKGGIAKAVMIAMGQMDAGNADREQRALAERHAASRRDEMGRIVDTAQGGDRTALAKLLAQSADPGLQQAGLGMLMKGPSKLERVDAGDRILLMDENGHTVGQIPKGVTPDTKYGKETVGADTKYTRETPSADALITDSRARSEGAANRGVTVRGQDLTDARSREAAETGKAPAGYRWNGDRLEAIPGGPAANKPLTESQSNAVAFGMRAKEMHANLSQMEKTGFVPSYKDVKTAGGESTNWMASGAGQKYLNMADNFTTAVLRKESGATITPAEQEQARKVYIPMPGDSDVVLKQKAANRELAIRALEAQSGRPQGGGWSIKPLD